MVNIIILIILILAVGSACLYIRKNSRNGIKCVGCSCASSCNNRRECCGGSKENPKEKE